MKDFVGKKLERIRIETTLPYIKGNLLDIGCGMNNLVKHYGGGTGVDVYPWEGVDVIVEDSAKLPFEDKNFDTISVIAALNHIPNREQVVIECNRLLKDNGQLLITMIPPFVSRIWHFLRSPWDVDQSERGMIEGEVYGLSKDQMKKLADRGNFTIDKTVNFMFGINRLYILTKKNVA